MRDSNQYCFQTIEQVFSKYVVKRCCGCGALRIEQNAIPDTVSIPYFPQYQPLRPVYRRTVRNGRWA